MRTIELLGRVDKDHRLCVEVPSSVPPGLVRGLVEVADDADDERSPAWAKAIAHAWAADWSDPREDMYTLEDGKPGMNPGEIHLAYFPFGGQVGTKPRPVLLLTGLLGPVPEVLVAYMTSVMPSTLLVTDVVLDPTQPEHAGTNFKTISLLRLHKLATIHQSDVTRYLGTLPASARTEVETKLRILLKI